MLSDTAVGWWDPIWCLKDANGRPRFETLSGSMPFINSTTDVAHMILVALKLAGRYPQKLDDAVKAMWRPGMHAAAQQQATAAAATAMVQWVNSLSKDSQEWEHAPEQLRQLLTDALSLDLSKRPPLHAILNYACVAEVRAQVGARVEQHRAGVEQQLAGIHNVMAQLLGDNDHLHTVRHKLQMRKEAEHRLETAALQQRADEQLKAAQAAEQHWLEHHELQAALAAARDNLQTDLFQQLDRQQETDKQQQEVRLSWRQSRSGWQHWSSVFRHSSRSWIRGSSCSCWCSSSKQARRRRSTPLRQRPSSYCWSSSASFSSSVSSSSGWHKCSGRHSHR
jgi:hypothetical protein